MEIDAASYEDAMKALRRAKVLNPRDPDIPAQLGGCLLESHGPNSADADAELRLALRLDPRLVPPPSSIAAPGRSRFFADERRRAFLRAQASWGSRTSSEEQAGVVQMSNFN